MEAVYTGQNLSIPVALVATTFTTASCCVWHEATWDLGTAMEIAEASFLHRLLMPGKEFRFAGSLFAS